MLLLKLFSFTFLFFLKVYEKLYIYRIVNYFMTMDDDINSQEIPLLTFNSLYNLLREEKRTKKLQMLPELFYEALKKYFDDKKDEIKNLKIGRDSNDKLKKEMHVLRKSQEISKELLNLRCSKIANITIKNTLFDEDVLSDDNILGIESDLVEYFKKGVRILKKEVQ